MTSLAAAASVLPSLLASSVEVTQTEFEQGFGGLIFMGLFFLAVIFAGIWWLRRG